MKTMTTKELIEYLRERGKQSLEFMEAADSENFKGYAEGRKEAFYHAANMIEIIVED